MSTNNDGNDNKNELRKIWEAAPERREQNDKKVAEGQAFLRIDNNKDGEVLESILREAGFGSPTVTEGIKIVQPNSRVLVRCEVIADPECTDYFVEIEADAGLENGAVVTKRKGSPWHE